MDKAKSVLVTGATGFIGRATVADLKPAGWGVTRGVRSIDAGNLQYISARSATRD
jgi:uncharacterized protein YbjT (DUF2867 family)